MEDNSHPDQSIWGESSLHQTRGAPRCLNTLAGGELVRRVAAGPVTVTDLAGCAGDRLAVLPALYDLLWRGVLAADLTAAPLSGRTMVRAGRAA